MTEPYNVWTLSDLHFGHKKIREYCKSRPENFEEVILANYLEVVRSNDKVYFLGDMVLRSGAQGRAHWASIAALPGHKYLVPGNHDHGSVEKLMRLGGFEQVFGEWTIYLTSTGNSLLLSHVPMVLTDFDDRYTPWRERVREAFVKFGCDLNIHGHTHERNTNDTHCVNVSVENIDFKPVLLDAIHCGNGS